MGTGIYSQFTANWLWSQKPKKMRWFVGSFPASKILL